MNNEPASMPCCQNVRLCYKTTIHIVTYKQVTRFQFHNPLYICPACHKLVLVIRLAFYFTLIQLLADLGPWKPFQQCPLTWWISVPSSTQISPLTDKRLCIKLNKCLWIMDGRTTARCRSRIYNLRTWQHHLLVLSLREAQQTFNYLLF